MSRVTLKLTFSGAVLQKRKALGLTQEDVADAVSISVRWFQLIEKGVRLPSFIVALRLIVLLDLDVTTFLKVVNIRVPVHSR